MMCSGKNKNNQFSLLKHLFPHFSDPLQCTGASFQTAPISTERDGSHMFSLNCHELGESKLSACFYAQEGFSHTCLCHRVSILQAAVTAKAELRCIPESCLINAVAEQRGRTTGATHLTSFFQTTQKQRTKIKTGFFLFPCQKQYISVIFSSSTVA